MSTLILSSFVVLNAENFHCICLYLCLCLCPSLRRSCVVADSRAGALSEAGDVVLNGAEDRIVAELGRVAEMTHGEREEMFGGGGCGGGEGGGSGGGAAPSLRRTTIFKNLGMAVQDAVAAKFVFDKIMTEVDGQKSAA